MLDSRERPTARHANAAATGKMTTNGERDVVRADCRPTPPIASTRATASARCDRSERSIGTSRSSHPQKAVAPRMNVASSQSSRLRMNCRWPRVAQLVDAASTMIAPVASQLQELLSGASHADVAEMASSVLPVPNSNRAARKSGRRWATSPQSVHATNAVAMAINASISLSGTPGGAALFYAHVRTQWHQVLSATQRLRNGPRKLNGSEGIKPLPLL